MMTEVLVAPDRSGERSQRDSCQVARDPVVAGAVAGTDTPPVDSDIVARVLGGTRVWVRGAPIARWGTSRGLMILRYLLLQDRPVPRDRLMDLLWPGSTPASARNNLNVAIYGLRRALEAGAPGPHVVFRDGAYRSRPIAASGWTCACSSTRVPAGRERCAMGGPTVPSACCGTL